MPSYTLHCPLCGEYFDRHLTFDADHSQVTCPQGHSPAERVYRPAPVVFKGHGYYITDSKGKSKTVKKTA